MTLKIEQYFSKKQERAHTVMEMVSEHTKLSNFSSNQRNAFHPSTYQKVKSNSSQNWHGYRETDALGHCRGALYMTGAALSIWETPFHGLRSIIIQLTI